MYVRNIPSRRKSPRDRGVPKSGTAHRPRGGGTPPRQITNRRTANR